MTDRVRDRTLAIAGSHASAVDDHSRSPGSDSRCTAQPGRSGGCPGANHIVELADLAADVVRSASGVTCSSWVIHQDKNARGFARQRTSPCYFDNDLEDVNFAEILDTPRTMPA
jgi:hypothetical protein